MKRVLGLLLLAVFGFVALGGVGKQGSAKY